jgi:integrase
MTWRHALIDAACRARILCDAPDGVKLFRPWEEARKRAELQDLQLRDLRHEAGSRFDKAGVSTNYVNKILGHASLTTTTRYLNIQRRGLHLAMEKLEESRKAAEEERRQKAEQEGKKAESVVHPLYKNSDFAPAVGSKPDDPASSKQLPS